MVQWTISSDERREHKRAAGVARVAREPVQWTGENDERRELERAARAKSVIPGEHAR